ncbi:hypothetical protein J1N35_006941 [Gossypium stocksii]|uniref:Uncharacterized protein n=1 Tax=Gossypium stocksii TaxID=47602 RepID=A0A9D4AF21_9ROSI|nr:hypothetical protein J1N35_006941 [Gossypium stocksii]
MSYRFYFCKTFFGQSSSTLIIFFLLLPSSSSSFLESQSSCNYDCRLAHLGGPLTTNKAVALAKFLERKLQDPNSVSSINPQLLELAVNNAKATVFQITESFVKTFADIDLNDDNQDSMPIGCDNEETEEVFIWHIQT